MPFMRHPAMLGDPDFHHRATGHICNAPDPVNLFACSRDRGHTGPHAGNFYIASGVGTIDFTFGTWQNNETRSSYLEAGAYPGDARRSWERAHSDMTARIARATAALSGQVFGLSIQPFTDDWVERYDPTGRRCTHRTTSDARCTRPAQHSGDHCSHARGDIITSTWPRNTPVTIEGLLATLRGETPSNPVSPPDLIPVSIDIDAEMAAMARYRINLAGRAGSARNALRLSGQEAF